MSNCVDSNFFVFVDVIATTTVQLQPSALRAAAYKPNKKFRKTSRHNLRFFFQPLGES